MDHCYQCTDHIPGTNTTCDGFSTTSSPQTCSDETCIKKVAGGRVTRYCGPRLQEEGCQYLEGGGARCVCSEDLCNGGDRPTAALVLVTVVVLMFGCPTTLASGYTIGPVDQSASSFGRGPAECGKSKKFV
ncbi:hypothetical protein FJT64_006372 [Amphibalanus amphitrite]|uniref:Protein sleepless n=1 Tax=Amphibalanus amphitrite TaxID=1232801 RepID=A0A6A4VT49_AMPAM|nr:hypothetical protein FJT64_006372 [Amphibalanus amphitrite]